MESNNHLKTIYYDSSSDLEFFNSDLILKKPIDLQFLNSTLKRRKQISKYKLPRFEKLGFIINIHKNEDAFNHVNSIMTRYIKKKNIQLLNSKTGMSYNEKGYIYFDQYALIGIKVRKFLKKVNARKRKYDDKQKIALLYLWEGKTANEIAKQTRTGIKTVKDVLWKIRYNKSSISDTILRKRYLPDLILCQNYKVILKQFDPHNISRKPLYEQYTHFKSKIADYDKISFKRYTWFCKEIMGMKYAKINRLKQNCDSKKHKKSRYLICMLLLEFIRKKVHLMFYDSSILCEGNYKNYAWTLEGNQNQKTFVPINRIFGSVSILMACTTKEIINFWISTKCNKMTTTSFLYETIIKYRKKYRNKILVIFMDNATLHYSKEMTLLAQKLGVYFVFNAPYSSKLNLIEYVFEKIKRNIRRKTDKKERMTLKDILFRELRKYFRNGSEIETKQFFKEIHKALQFRNMWSTMVRNKKERIGMGIV